MNVVNTWTPWQLQILIKEYPVAKNTRDLADKIGKPYNAIKSKAAVLKLYRQVANSGMSNATPEEIKYIKENYLQLPLKVIADHLGNGRTYTFVKGRMDAMGLVRPADLIQKIKQETYIKKGNVPVNKGKKQKDYMSRQAIARTKATRFKKGHLPKNTKSDFEVTVRVDKRGVSYKFIRIALGEWIPLQRYNWIKKYGPIPEKRKIVFKDGNTMNCSVRNLISLTPAQLMQINSYHTNYPKSIAQIIQLRGALTRQINKHLKKQNEKQNQRSA